MILPPWLLLVAAIVAEVAATLSLDAYSHGQYGFVVVVVAGYAAAFVLLGRVLAAGLPIGVVYGVWSAGGVTLTALLGSVLFDDPLTTQMWLGFACICVGVYLAESGHAATKEHA